MLGLGIVAIGMAGAGVGFALGWPWGLTVAGGLLWLDLHQFGRAK